MIAKWISAVITGAALLLATAPALPATPIKDKEYTLVDPAQPPLEGSPGKNVEVIEFFYYGAHIATTCSRRSSLAQERAEGR